MSEYGLKIKNIEAATLYEYNNGVRDHYEYKDAMFTNSLFSDFLKENGLKVWKEESTRDLICLEFNFGSRSYEEEIEHLKKIAKDSRTEYKLAKSYGYNSQVQKKKNKRKKDRGNVKKLRCCLYNDRSGIKGRLCKKGTGKWMSCNV